MASIDRYMPPTREAYRPPNRPPNANSTSAHSGRPSKSPSKRREVPPAVPSPPTHAHYLSSRNSPSRPQSHRSAATPARSSPDKPRIGKDQWYFTQDEINSSPSIVDGISLAEERLRRAKGVNFIYQAGILLDLPQITLYVAGVFFHRFYMRMSMVEEGGKGGIHHYNIAATALFLANKTEENCRKTKDIIIAVARVAQKNAKLIIDEQSKEYWRWRDSILMHEEIMLEKLTFDLIVDNPHMQLYKLLEHINVIHNKTLRHAAWAFCNDACLSTLPLVMDARDIAITSIFFSSFYTKERIEDVDGRPWWHTLNGDETKMSQGVEILRVFYTENPLRKQENPYQGTPPFNLEDTRKNGEGSSTNATPRTTDRDTQSPKSRVNGTTTTADSKDQDISSALEEASQAAPGDSDAALKEAANDPASHPTTNGNGNGNGNGLLSPGVKRREVESLSSETREHKRQRMSSDDEGEVQE
ncbi:cyclin-K [Xylariales sp. AK1849]|nr:cyclin-K [Xylariales sp. AK1849]